MSSGESLSVTEAIRRFLDEARDPVVFEPGEDPLPIAGDNHEIREEAGRIVFQIWTANRNLLRRVLSVESAGKGQLTVTIEKFGKRIGSLHFLDATRPAAAEKTRRAARLTFREVFRKSLLRQYPGWKIVELSSEPDLEHSLSPAHSRAFLRNGGRGLAAIGSASLAETDSALSFGLIWLDYLRHRESSTAVERLAMFLPEGGERATAHRLRYLHPASGVFELFVHADGGEQRVDLRDIGNIETSLPERHIAPPVPPWMRAITEVSGVEIAEAPPGLSLRIHGLEFAHWNGRELRAGIEKRRMISPGRIAEVRALALELASARREHGPGRLASAVPERWLESEVRANLPVIDAGLAPEPVYSQAPSFSAAERGVIDLLAVGLDGRLAVLELKASEDIHLPLQALDYWIRVKWHLDRGEFASRGYFRGIDFRPEPPRLLLIAPALHFHPTTETILRYLSSDVDVERIGLAAGWRSELKVVFRACGSSRVQCEDWGENQDESHKNAAADSGRSDSPESDGGT